MMTLIRKTWWITVSLCGAVGCASATPPPAATNCPEPQETVPAPTATATATSQPPQACAGTATPPAEFADALQPVEDEALLASALGKPGEGKLCQGRVYQVKEGSQVVLHRAWNSTHSGSRLGKWWAATKPEGSVARYRADYEICYQWSPLDKLTHCKVKAGTKLVIGNGQSATCSEYLKYPVSAAKQFYLANADSQTSDCVDYDGLFNWQASEQP